MLARAANLDSWHGVTFVSLVGFLFANTRVLGVPVPWHRTFEEVNLRFYVRRTVNGEVRRAVTFLREVVPHRLTALVARLAYNEPYRALQMRHRFGPLNADGVPTTVEYGWRLPAGWAGVSVHVIGPGHTAVVGSQEEFITEHFWGYTRQRDGGTVEYQVTHPAWRIWSVQAPQVDGELSSLYGAEVARLLRGPPASAFLADGSAVTVHLPSRLTK